MKKRIKVFGVLLAVMLVATASVAAWQWKNIKSIYTGITETPEDISKRMDENRESLAEELREYLDTEIRDMTPEEKKQIADGEATAEEIYLKIYQEVYEKKVRETSESSMKNSVGEKQAEKEKEASEKPNSKEDKTVGNAEEKADDNDKSNSGSKTNSSKTNKSKAKGGNKTTSSAKSSASKDEIVSKYVAQLYGLQGKYTAQAEATVAEGKSYYRELRRSKKDKATARAEAIRQYTPVVRSIQAQCDAEVAAVIASLENELKAIEENTDIVGTIKNAYENEKQLKLSYYSGQYLN